MKNSYLKTLTLFIYLCSVGTSLFSAEPNSDAKFVEDPYDKADGTEAAFTDPIIDKDTTLRFVSGHGGNPIGQRSFYIKNGHTLTVNLNALNPIGGGNVQETIASKLIFTNGKNSRVILMRAEDNEDHLNHQFSCHVIGENSDKSQVSVEVNMTDGPQFNTSITFIDLPDTGRLQVKNTGSTVYPVYIPTHIDLTVAAVRMVLQDDTVFGGVLIGPHQFIIDGNINTITFNKGGEDRKIKTKDDALMLPPSLRRIVLWDGNIFGDKKQKFPRFLATCTIVTTGAKKTVIIPCSEISLAEGSAPIIFDGQTAQISVNKLLTLGVPVEFHNLFNVQSFEGGPVVMNPKNSGSGSGN